MKVEKPKKSNEKDFLEQWEHELSLWQISMKESKRQKEERLKKLVDKNIK